MPAVGKVVGSYYAILLDFNPRAFLATTLHSALLYSACTVLSATGTWLQRRLALSWRSRLTSALHDAYCEHAAFASPALENPDQRIARDTRSLCDDLAAVARVAAGLPFRIVFYAALTAGYLGWRGLAVAAGFVISAAVLQWTVAKPLARAVYAQESAEGDLRTAHARLRALGPDVALAGHGSGVYGAERAALEAAALGALHCQERLVGRQVALQAATKAVDYGAALLTYSAVALAVFAGARAGASAGVTAQFVSNSAFATMALMYAFTELGDTLNTYSRMPGVLARVVELMEMLGVQNSQGGAKAPTAASIPRGPAVLLEPTPYPSLAYGGMGSPEFASSTFATEGVPEVSVHSLPPGSDMHARAGAVFPQAPTSRALLACLTIQPMAGASGEAGMDGALARLLAWTHAVHAALHARGWWVDVVNPASGAPLLGPPGSRPWAEPEAVRQLLGYPIASGLGCSLILHPRFGARVYPATLLTDAPWPVLATVLGVGSDTSVDLLRSPLGIRTAHAPLPLLTLKQFTVNTRDGRCAVRGLDLTLVRGRSVLLVGPNGAGKSTLLRALAGQAPVAGGTAAFAAGARVVWVPQRPLPAPGPLLWHQLVYPEGAPRPDPAAAAAALRAVGLAGLLGRAGGSLDGPAPRGLSPGELQRVGFARLLLHPPDLAVVDEPTAALGAEGARGLYAVAAAAGVTFLSVGQDMAHLHAVHDAVLVLVGEGGAWRLDPSNPPEPRAKP